MTHIRVVDEASATGELKDAYEDVRKARGSVGNLFLAEGLAPKAVKAHLALYDALMFGEGPLSRREREMIAVAVSVANECSYCIVHHADALGRYVTEPGLVPLLVGDWRKAPLDPRERAIVEAAVKLTREPHLWSRQDVETLHLQGLTDEETLHVVHVASYFNFANRVANGVGVKPEDADKKYNY